MSESWIPKKTDPAEPINPSGDHRGYSPTTGLTKREHFALMAMQGILAGGALDVIMKMARSRGVSPTIALAHTALDYADGLIVTLNETSPTPVKMDDSIEPFDRALHDLHKEPTP